MGRWGISCSLGFLNPQQFTSMKSHHETHLQPFFLVLHLSFFLFSGWLKDSKIVFQSLFLSLHKEFRMSLKVKYSALQKAGQQGIFFFSHAAKMSHFILCGIEKSGTPMQCPSTTCRSFEQITPQNASLCPTPLILKFEVLISSKFKIFFSFLKKKKKSYRK